MTRDLTARLLEVLRAVAGQRPLDALPQSLRDAAAAARKSAQGRRRHEMHCVSATMQDVLDEIEAAEARGDGHWPPSEIVSAVVSITWYLARKKPCEEQGS